jgi:hypothetical protein
MKIFVALFCIMQTACVQKVTPYDKAKVSKETELNLAHTDKRGIESKIGIVYYVEKDKKILSAYENGRIKWVANIINACGEPFVGAPEIRYFKLSKDVIEIVFGKHSYANIDISSGKIKCLGAD